jgi:perosamine synthetase
VEVRLFKPSVGKEELENVRQVFGRAWLGLGPLVGQFEQEWTEYIGARTSVGVNSGTAALHLSLAAFRFPRGKKVLVPAITFVSTATAAVYNGLEPVFVDVRPDTLGLDLDDLKKKIDPDCVAVVPVHFGGHPVPMDDLLNITRPRNIAVVEDCAHCAGGVYKGKRLGTWGNVGCFSFEEKKCMTTGDGGMMSSLEPELIEPLRANRWVGIDKDTWRRNSSYTDAAALDTRHWYYEIEVLGYKYNMNDLMAAIGLAQLKKLDGMNAKRRTILRRYLNGIASCEKIRPMLPYDLEEESAYWIFGVRTADRDGLIAHMKRRGIATGVHYMPLPFHPLFQSHKEPIPVSTDVWSQVVTLPLFPDLEETEVDYVIEALLDYEKA